MQQSSSKEPVNFFRFRFEGREMTEKGRNAWALASLVEAGETGCSPILTPGPRWSSYVHKLKKRGLTIETRMVNHPPPFAGSHAVYILRSAIEPVEVKTAPSSQAAA